jgi:hypothetical protein
VVGTGDAEAIAVLLNNPTAQIREDTLDAVIAAAPHQPAWHEPLVRRGVLSPAAVLRIAEFVAGALVQELSRRADLEAATAAMLTEMVKGKLRDKAGSPGLSATTQEDILSPTALSAAEAQVDYLVGLRKLSPENVMRAANAGQIPLVVAALARLAALPTNVVAEVARAASAKGMLAVAWAANFSAIDAVQLQVKIARVPPEAVIKARAGGGFDAGEAELQWQLDMYREAVKFRA